MATTNNSKSGGTSTATSQQSGGENNIIQQNCRPFSRINIILMLVCVALIVIGFVLMVGKGSSVEEGFNPDIFSSLRTVVAPSLAFLGFLGMAFAIIYTPKKSKN